MNFLQALGLTLFFTGTFFIKRNDKKNKSSRQASYRVANNKNVLERIKQKDKKIVFFTASWCGHCKKLEKDNVFLNLEEKLKGKNISVLKFDVGNGGEHVIVRKKLKIDSFPTIRLYSENGTVVPYDGERTADKIANFVLNN